MNSSRSLSSYRGAAGVGLVLLLLLVTQNEVAAQDLADPPEAGDVPLFLIERSINGNIVHYDARVTKDGKLDPIEPVRVYWAMVNGQRENLNALEKSRVYGIRVAKDSSPNAYHVYLAAKPDKEILVYLVGGRARAEALIGGHRAYLEKIYVSVGKVAIFHINYIELFGIDVVTGDSRRERIDR